MWRESAVYRIKPEVKKYKISLNASENGLPYTMSVDKIEQAFLREQSPQFIRWLTDWTIYELEAGTETSSK